MPHFDFNTYRTESLSGIDGELNFRAWYNIPYTDRPTAPDIQILHIFIPEVYFHGGVMHGFSAHTAPIFFPNAIGGYMEAYPCCPSLLSNGRFNTEAAALAHGYVVISAGARGKNTQVDGRNVGKAPAAIVDLKAAVRFIRSIADKICGDAEKIIANGTSAGGALSALLAASGDSPFTNRILRKSVRRRKATAFMRHPAIVPSPILNMPMPRTSGSTVISPSCIRSIGNGKSITGRSHLLYIRFPKNEWRCPHSFACPFRNTSTVPHRAV